MNEFVSSSLRINLPYQPQWASGNLIGDIVQGKISASEDPYWHESGATTPEEYEYWAGSICGMACLRSILLHVYGQSPPLITLAKECAEYGGYKQNGNGPDKLYYAPFAQYVEERFQLEATVARTLCLDEILTEVGQGNFVMASVNSAIRDPQSTPSQKGGHLVLMTGYNLKDQTVSFHDPAGTHQANQWNATVSIDNFMKFFAERGIVIQNPIKQT